MSNEQLNKPSMGKPIHAIKYGEGKRRGINAINEPGVRPHRSGEGVVVQMAKRSKQLSSISDTIVNLTNDGKNEEPITLTVKQARELWGMAQTIGIVADELKSAGK